AVHAAARPYAVCFAQGARWPDLGKETRLYCETRRHGDAHHPPGLFGLGLSNRRLPPFARKIARSRWRVVDSAQGGRQLVARAGSINDSAIAERFVDHSRSGVRAWPRREYSNVIGIHRMERK